MIRLNEAALSMIFGVLTVVMVGILVVRMYQANANQDILEEGAYTQAYPTPSDPCFQYSEFMISQIPGKCFGFFMGGSK